MKPANAKPVTIVPITLPTANQYIERLHRHHGKMPGGFELLPMGHRTCRPRFWAHALTQRRQLERPAYTLEDEGGASLRAVGWVREEDGIRSWWSHAGTRTPAVQREHMQKSKVRWAKHFRAPVELPDELKRPASPQKELFTE